MRISYKLPCVTPQALIVTPQCLWVAPHESHCYTAVSMSCTPLWFGDTTVTTAFVSPQCLWVTRHDLDCGTAELHHSVCVWHHNIVLLPHSVYELHLIRLIMHYSVYEFHHTVHVWYRNCTVSMSDTTRIQLFYHSADELQHNVIVWYHIKVFQLIHQSLSALSSQWSL